jgi:hypothetical protein
MARAGDQDVGAGALVKLANLVENRYQGGAFADKARDSPAPCFAGRKLRQLVAHVLQSCLGLFAPVGFGEQQTVRLFQLRHPFL